MITAVTGAPGIGKTKWALRELARVPSRRKIYTHGISGLGFAHERIYCKSQYCEFCAGIFKKVGNQYLFFDSKGRIDVVNPCNENPKFIQDFYQWAVEGDLIVLDDSDRLFFSMKAVPDDKISFDSKIIGPDFLIITQDLFCFSPNIRALIDRHICILSKNENNIHYEWIERGNCKQ